MLTQKQIDLFQQQGYLVVEDVLDQESVLDPVREEYTRLLSRLYTEWFNEGLVETPPHRLDFNGQLLEAYHAGCDWFQPMDISLPGDRILADTPMHFGPAVYDMITNERLLDLVECLIGLEITSNPIQHVRMNPPSTSSLEDEIRPLTTASDWHQDRGVAHEDADKTEMITVWLAVSDATVENGCLQVLPKAPNQDMSPYCLQVQSANAPGCVDEEKAIPLPVKSGGAVIFHPMTPHSSLVNDTDGIGWSFDLRYSKTGQPSGRTHFPDFIARSTTSPHSVLKDWRKWRTLWEGARAQLSSEPHIDIHRWQSDSPLCA